MRLKLIGQVGGHAEVKGGDTPVGATVEFAEDGKVTANVKLDCKDVKLDGTYKLDGKKLKVNLTLNEQKIEHEFTITFKSDTRNNAGRRRQEGGHAQKGKK